MFLAIKEGYINRGNWFTNWFFDPSFIEIGNFQIAKYAICILTGVVLAYIICTKEGEKMGIQKDKVLTALIIILPVAILFARIGYMLTDGESTFATKISQYGFFGGLFGGIMSVFGFPYAPIDFTFEGVSGLTIIGGIVAAIVGALVASKVNKWNLLNVLDMVVPGLLIGQICGRWGNFFNQEAYGSLVTNEALQFFPFAVYIENTGGHFTIEAIEQCMNFYGNADMDGAWFNATFFYESFMNLVGLALYFVVRRKFKRLRTGMITGGYLVWYGIVRFFVEALRTDSLYINIFGLSLKNAQFFGVVFLLLGLALIIYLGVSKKTELYQDSLKKGAIRFAEERKESEDEVIVISPSKNNSNNMENAELGENPKEDN